MLKWIVILVAGYFLFRMLTNDRRQKEKREEVRKERMAATGEMVKDPVCGAFVPKDGDIRVRDGETVHTFCSYDCRDKYLDSLEQSGREIPESAKLEPEDEWEDLSEKESEKDSK